MKTSDKHQKLAACYRDLRSASSDLGILINTMHAYYLYQELHPGKKSNMDFISELQTETGVSNQTFYSRKKDWELLSGNTNLEKLMKLINTPMANRMDLIRTIANSKVAAGKQGQNYKMWDELLAGKLSPKDALDINTLGKALGVVDPKKAQRGGARAKGDSKGKDLEQKYQAAKKQAATAMEKVKTEYQRGYEDGILWAVSVDQKELKKKAKQLLDTKDNKLKR